MTSTFSSDWMSGEGALVGRNTAEFSEALAHVIHKPVTSSSTAEKIKGILRVSQNEYLNETQKIYFSVAK